MTLTQKEKDLLKYLKEKGASAQDLKTLTDIAKSIINKRNNKKGTL